MRLPVQFLGSSSSSYSRGGSYGNRDQPNMFAWTIFITLLIVIAGGTWMFSLLILAFPEKAWAYGILNKFDKLPELKTYSATSVPAGKFHTGREFWQIFTALHLKDRNQFDDTNAGLKRNYIRNFGDDPPLYLKGHVRTRLVRGLAATDVFQSGVVYRGESFEVSTKGKTSEELFFPNAVIEFVVPASESPEGNLKHTKDIVFNANYPVSLVNVAKLRDDKMVFTFVPLIYQDFELDTDATLAMKPPAQLNLNGRWPLTDEGIGDTSTTPSPAADPAPKVAEK